MADVYDALASTRPYRPALAHAKCLKILRADAAGGGLDAELVERFAAMPPPASGPQLGQPADPEPLLSARPRLWAKSQQRASPARLLSWRCLDYVGQNAKWPCVIWL